MAVYYIRTKENTTNLPLRKLRIACVLFKDGFLSQLHDESTAGLALGVGLIQGMKYKGDVKNGIRSGVVAGAAICTLAGFRNVLENINNVTELVVEGK